MKIILFILVLSGCTQPLTDAQVAAGTQRCKELGMAVHVFNGAVNFAKCVEVPHE